MIQSPSSKASSESFGLNKLFGLKASSGSKASDDGDNANKKMETLIKQTAQHKIYHDAAKDERFDDLDAYQIKESESYGKTFRFGRYFGTLKKSDLLDEIYTNMTPNSNENNHVGDLAFLYIAGHGSCEKSNCSYVTKNEMQDIMNQDSDTIRRLLNNIQIIGLSDTGCISGISQMNYCLQYYQTIQQTLT